MLNFIQQTILGLKALKLTSVIYNSVSTTISNTAFAGWSTSRGYDEVLLIGLKEVMGIHYSNNKNQTTVVTYVNGSLAKQVVAGKRFLSVSTDRGKIIGKVLK